MDDEEAPLDWGKILLTFIALGGFAAAAVGLYVQNKRAAAAAANAPKSYKELFPTRDKEKPLPVIAAPATAPTPGTSLGMLKVDEEFKAPPKPAPAAAPAPPAPPPAPAPAPAKKTVAAKPAAKPFNKPSLNSGAFSRLNGGSGMSMSGGGPSAGGGTAPAAGAPGAPGADPAAAAAAAAAAAGGAGGVPDMSKLLQGAGQK